MSEKSDRSDSVSFPRQIADRIIQAIRLAAQQEILPHFRALQPEQIAQKSDALDLVTTADLASEALITEALSALFPDALIIGEEAVARSPGLLDNIDSAPLCFIIDPIDGTIWRMVDVSVVGDVSAPEFEAGSRQPKQLDVTRGDLSSRPADGQGKTTVGTLSRYRPEEPPGVAPRNSGGGRPEGQIVCRPGPCADGSAQSGGATTGTRIYR